MFGYSIFASLMTLAITIVASVLIINKSVSMALDESDIAKNLEEIKKY